VGCGEGVPSFELRVSSFELSFKSGAEWDSSNTYSEPCGEVNHLELWIDGNKIGNYPGASMNANVRLAGDPHAATVVEVDSQLHYVKSNPVTLTAR